MLTPPFSLVYEFVFLCLCALGVRGLAEAQS